MPIPSSWAKRFTVCHKPASVVPVLGRSACGPRLCASLLQRVTNPPAWCRASDILLAAGGCVPASQDPLSRFVDRRSRRRDPKWNRNRKPLRCCRSPFSKRDAGMGRVVLDDRKPLQCRRSPFNKHSLRRDPPVRPSRCRFCGRPAAGPPPEASRLPHPVSSGRGRRRAGRAPTPFPVPLRVPPRSACTE